MAPRLNGTWGFQAAQEASCLLLRTHKVPTSLQSSQVPPVLETSQQHVALIQEDWMPREVRFCTCGGCALHVEKFRGVLSLPLGSAAVITWTAAGLNRRWSLLAASAWCRTEAANTVGFAPLVRERVMRVCVVCVLRWLCTGSLKVGCTALGLVYTTDCVQCADSTSAAQVPHQAPWSRKLHCNQRQQSTMQHCMPLHAQ